MSAGKSAMRLAAVAVVILAMASCHRQRIIPRSDLTNIFVDMFMADEWVTVNMPVRNTADSTWFYEPIFNKYGYSTPDFIRSVDYYMDDPDRFTQMLEMSDSMLSLKVLSYKDSISIKKRIEHFEEMMAQVDSGTIYYTLYDQLFAKKDTSVDTVWFFGQHAPILEVDFEPDSNRVLISPMP